MSNPELTGRPSPLDRRAHALVRALSPTTSRRRSAARRLSAGLGWLGIGLGLAEVFMARRVARTVGVNGGVNRGVNRGARAMLPLHGVREIVTGVGLLAARSPAGAVPWVWARVAGDALDLATLAAAAATPGRPLARSITAMLAVAGVAALDLACARTLRAEANASRQSTDYSDRSGLGGPPEALRGAARADFANPAGAQGGAAALLRPRPPSPG